MPMSLKCMIDKWLHKGQISQEEYDAVIKKLDGHNKQISAEAYKQGRADEQLQSIEDAKEQAKEYRVALEKAKEEVYKQGAKEFAEWLYRRKCFDGWYKFDGNEEVKLTTDEILAEWQKGENV